MSVRLMGFFPSCTPLLGSVPLLLQRPGFVFTEDYVSKQSLVRRKGDIRIITEMGEVSGQVGRQVGGWRDEVY